MGLDLEQVVEEGFVDETMLYPPAFCATYFTISSRPSSNLTQTSTIHALRLVVASLIYNIDDNAKEETTGVATQKHFLCIVIPHGHQVETAHPGKVIMMAIV